jgi:hypothetical protein
MTMEYKWKWKRTWVNPAINVGALTASSAGLAFSIFSHLRTKKVLNEIQHGTKEIKKETEEIESDLAQLVHKLIEDSAKINVLLQQAMHVIAEHNAQGTVFLESHEDEIVRTMGNHPTTSDFVEQLRMNGIEASIFDPDEIADDWNYEKEEQNRTSDAPYIIHKDEYLANEKDYRQSTLTYYKSDNILCDESDTPVYNIDKIVGKLEFGKGSRDPSIVYIRNETLESEYEILLDHGWYQVEVLGQAVEDHLNGPDVKHSLHKFREEE